MTLTAATQPANHAERGKKKGRDVICQLNKINLIIKTRVRCLERKKRDGGRRWGDRRVGGGVKRKQACACPEAQLLRC